MRYFSYSDQAHLYVESVPIARIAQRVGTPFYCYSQAALVANWHGFCDALRWADRRLICFSVKANSNVAILQCLGALGAGMDVVSGGEYARARAAGVAGQKIVFSGVGKTAQEMTLSLQQGIYQFNIESHPELLLLNRVALDLGTQAPVTIRINPDVDAGTHAKITTGKADNKFGVPIAKANEIYTLAATLKGIKVVGIDMHIGSQLQSLAPFRQAYQKMAALARFLRSAGHNIDRLDFGGGIGIAMAADNPSPIDVRAYGDLIRDAVADLGCEIQIEPGRSMIGNAGIMVSRVLYQKTGQNRNFLILDAAMNDLIRPALYDAHHEIMPIKRPAPAAAHAKTLYDIVGPVCESADTFATQCALPAGCVGAGDLVAFLSAGAYGAVMASEYNSRPLIPEVLVSGDRFFVIRERPHVSELLGRDKIPPWL